MLLALVAVPVLMMLALAVRAQEAVFWGNDDGLPSVAILEPTDAPGAVAQVTFWNDNRHNTRHRDTLVLGGLVVEIELWIDWPGVPADAAGRPDRAVVHVPDGYMVDPPEAIVPEQSTQVFLIYALESVGF
jgi:hypothetical protein